MKLHLMSQSFATGSLTDLMMTEQCQNRDTMAIAAGLDLYSDVCIISGV